MQIGSNAAEQNIPCRTFLGHAFPRARRVTGAWPGRRVKRWIWYETVHFWCKNSLRIALYFGSNLWLLGAAPSDPCSFFIGTKMQEIGPDLPNFRQIVCILKASVHACFEFDVSDALGCILGGLFFAKIFWGLRPQTGSPLARSFAAGSMEARKPLEAPPQTCITALVHSMMFRTPSGSALAWKDWTFFILTLQCIPNCDFCQLQIPDNIHLYRPGCPKKSAAVGECLWFVNGNR